MDRSSKGAFYKQNGQLAQPSSNYNHDFNTSNHKQPYSRNYHSNQGLGGHNSMQTSGYAASMLSSHNYNEPSYRSVVSPSNNNWNDYEGSVVGPSASQIGGQNILQAKGINYETSTQKQVFKPQIAQKQGSTLSMPNLMAPIAEVPLPTTTMSSTMTAELDDAKQKLSSMTSRSQQLESYAQQAQQQMAKSNQIIEQLQRGVAERDQHLQQHRLTIEKMNKAMQQQHQVSQELQASAIQLREQVDTLGQQSLNYQKTIVERETVLRAREQQLAVLLDRSQKDAQSSVQGQAEHMTRVLKMKVVELEESVGGKAKIIQMLNAELQSKDNSHNESQKMILVLQKSVQTLNDQVGVLTGENEQYKSDIQTAESNLEAAKNSNEAEITQWQAQANEASGKISDLMETINQKETDIETEKQRTRDTETQLSTERKSKEQLESDLEAARTQIQLLDTQVNEVNSTHKDDQSNIATLKQHIQARDQMLQQQAAQFENQLKDSETKHDTEKQALTESIREHQNGIEKLKAGIDQLNAEKMQLQHENRKLENDFAARNEQLRMLQEDQNNRAVEFDEERSRLDYAKNQSLQALNDEIQAERIATAKAQAERDIFKEKLETLKEQSDKSSNEQYQQSVTWRKEKMKHETTVLELKSQIERQNKLTEAAEMQHKIDLNKIKENHNLELEDVEARVKNELRRQIRDLQDKTHDIEKDKNSQIRKLELTIQDMQLKLKTSVDDKDDEITSKSLEFVKLEEKFKTINANHQNTIKEKSDLEKKVEELKSLIEQKETEISETKLEAEAETKKILEETTNKESLWQAEKGQLEQYLRSVGEHVKAQHEQHEKRKEAWNKEKDEIEENMTQLKDDKKELQIEIDNLKTTLSGEQQQLQDSLERTKTKFKRLQEQLKETEKAHKEEIENLNQEKEEFMEKLKSGTDTFDKHQEQTLQFKHEQSKLLAVQKEKISTLEREIKHKVEDFEFEKEQLESSLQAAVKRAELLHKQLTDQQHGETTKQIELIEELSAQEENLKSVEKQLAETRSKGNEDVRKLEKEKADLYSELHDHKREITNITEKWKIQENELIDSVDQLTKDLQVAKSDIDQKNLEISELQTQSDIRQNTIEQLNEQIQKSSSGYKDRTQNLNKTIQDLMSQLDDKSAEFQKKQAEVNSLKLKTSQFDVEQKRMKTNHNQLVTELQDKIEELKANIDSSEKELLDRQEHFKETLAKYEEKLKNSNKAEEELSLLASEKIKISSEMKSLNEKLQSYKDEHANLKNDAENLKLENSSLKSSLSKSKSEMEKVSLEYSVSEKVLDTLKKDKQKLETMLQNTLQNPNANKQSLSSYNAEKEKEHLKQIKELTSQNHRLKSQYENLKIQNQDNCDKNEKEKSPTPTKSVVFYDEVESKRQLSEAQEKITSLEEKITSLESELKNATTRASSLQDSDDINRKLQDDNARFHRENNSLKSQVNDLSQKLNRVTAIQSQIAFAQSISLNKTQEEVQLRENSINELSHKITDLQSRYNEVHKKNREYQQQVSTLEKQNMEISALEEEKQYLNEKFLESLTRVQTLESEKSNLSTNYARHRLDLVQLRSENQQLRMEIDSSKESSKNQTNAYANFENVLQDAINQRVKMEIELKRTNRDHIETVDALTLKYQQELELKDQEIKNVLEKNRAETKSYDDKYSEVDFTSEKFTQLNSEIADLQHEINVLKNQNSEITSSHDQVKKLEAELSILKQELDLARNLNDEMSRATSPVGGSRELCKQLESLVIEKQRLQREIGKLKQELKISKEKESNYDDVNRKYLAALSETQRYRTESELNDSEITQVKEENRRLANRLNEIDENLTIIKTERDQLQTRNDMLSAELEAIREQLDNEYQERSNIIIELNSRIDELIEEKNQLIEKLTEVQSESAASELISRLSEVVGEKEELQEKWKELQQEYQIVLDAKTRQDSEISFLQFTINDFETKTKEMEKNFTQDLEAAKKELMESVHTSSEQKVTETPQVDVAQTHALMCELEDLRDQFETETRLRTEAESRLRQQEEDKKAFEHMKQELDDTQNFMRQFEVALLDDLSKSSSSIPMPDIPPNCSSAERLQVSISAYFAHQEQQKNRLLDAEKQLEQFCQGSSTTDEIKGASLQATIPVSLDENNSGSRDSPKAAGKSSCRAGNANPSTSGSNLNVEQPNKKSKKTISPLKEKGQSKKDKLQLAEEGFTVSSSSNWQQW